MKKLFALLLCVIFTYAGLWLALIAEVNDAHPFDQGAQSIGAALLFASALLCAGWGQSLTWSGKKKVKQ